MRAKRETAHRCPICAHGEPLDVVAELATTWITAQAEAPLPGYVCVVSKRHVVEPFELPGPELAAFWHEAMLAARTLDELFRPTKMNYEIHGNTIPHLHLHLYPRFADDPYVGGPIDARLASFTRSPEQLHAIRQAFEGIGIMQSTMSPESTADNRRLVGRCECGTVRYEVADAFLYAANCHCSRCRAATGSAFKAFAGIEREKLEVTAGRETVLVVGAEDLNDTRCGACGSLLFSVVRDGAYVHVAMGSLVDAPSIRPTEHIFVGSKAPWFEITDDLPQFEEYAT